MPLDLLSIFLGFILGSAAVAIAWNLMQKPVRNPETTRLTAVWSLRDVATAGTRPVMLAEGVEGLSVPPGTKLVVPRGRIDSVPPEVLATCEVRMHADVRVNAAVGKDRALLFSGKVSPKAYAVFTMDEATVRQLQNDFERMWKESSPYVQTTALKDLGSMAGRVVDVTGQAVDVMEFRGRKMLRLTDGKVAVGVVAAKEDVSAYPGSMLRIVGRMHKEAGYAYVEADKVEVLSGHAAA
jgi:hypothetical protein